MSEEEKTSDIYRVFYIILGKAALKVIIGIVLIIVVVLALIQASSTRIGRNSPDSFRKIVEDVK